MDLSKLKTVYDLLSYEQLTRTLQSIPDYRNILISENNVDFLVSIDFWELNYYKKHGCNGAAVIILQGMLRMPPSKNWSMLSSKFIKVLENWLQFVIGILNDVHWWSFMENIMDILENLCAKDNLIKLLVVEKLTKHLLKLVLNDKVVINKKILILKCLNKCVYQCGWHAKKCFAEGLMHLFVKLSRYMSTCGHMDMQLKLFETLMSWLLYRNDQKGRAEVASLLFTEEFYYRNTIDKFIQSEFQPFAKDAAEWLNHHNTLTGRVYTFIYKNIIVGNNNLQIRQPSRLHLNIVAKCITAPIGQTLLTNIILPYSEILTVSEENAESVEFITGQQLTLNIKSIDGPEFIYERTANLIVTENTLIEIQISNRSEICQVEWALKNIFRSKYKRVYMESTDKLSPTPSGCNELFSQSIMEIETENLNVNPRAYGINNMEVDGRKNSSPVAQEVENSNVDSRRSGIMNMVVKGRIDNSSPEAQEVENSNVDSRRTGIMNMVVKRRIANSSPEAQRLDNNSSEEKDISLPDQDNEENVDDVIMHVSPSVKSRNITTVETNSLLFDASINSDYSVVDSLCDIDRDLVNDIIIDALNVNHTEATAQPEVPTSPKSNEGPRELVVSKSTSVDEGSSEAVISDTPAGFVNISRKRPCEVKNVTQNGGKVYDFPIEKNEDNEIDVIDNTLTQNDNIPKRRELVDKENKEVSEKVNNDITVPTRKKRKLYSPKDEAELFNRVNHELNTAEFANDVDDPFDRLRMMPTYPDKNQEDVTSNYSMQLRSRSAKIFKFSSDDDLDYTISNQFANRIGQKCVKKPSKKPAKERKTAVKKASQTKKRPKQKVTKINYTLVDEKVRKSHNEVLDTSITNVPTYNDELTDPDPKPHHIYPEVVIENLDKDSNNSIASIRSLNIEVEQPNVNNNTCDNFVDNVKNVLIKKTGTGATKTLQTNIASLSPQLVVERSESVQEDRYEDCVESKEYQSNIQKSVEHDTNDASKSHLEIVPLDQVLYTKPHDSTSSQDFQSQKLKRQSYKSKESKTQQKTVPKKQKKCDEKKDSGFKTVQKSKDNLSDIWSSDDFQIKKPIIKLQRLKNDTGLKSVQASIMNVTQKKNQEKNDTEIKAVQASNVAVPKTQKKTQLKRATRIKSAQESNKNLKQQKKNQEEKDTKINPVQKSKNVAKKQNKFQLENDTGITTTVQELNDNEIKSVQESNIAVEQKKTQEKTVTGVTATVQELFKSMAKTQNKPREKDDPSIKEEESNKSFNDTRFSENLGKRTQILKISRLKNIDEEQTIKKKTERTKSVNDKDTENVHLIRKSSRLLEKSRQSLNESLISESPQNAIYSIRKSSRLSGKPRKSLNESLISESPENDIHSMRKSSRLSGKPRKSLNKSLISESSENYINSTRKSSRLSGKSRQSLNESLIRESPQNDVSWDSFQDSECINTNCQPPSASRNTSTPNEESQRSTRSRTSTQEQPSTSSLFVKLGCLVDYHNRNRTEHGQSSISIEESQEETPREAPVEITNKSERPQISDIIEEFKGVAKLILELLNNQIGITEKKLNEYLSK